MCPKNPIHYLIPVTLACALMAFARPSLANGGHHSDAGWRKSAHKDGKWRSGRFVTPSDASRGYYLVKKPSATQHGSWHHPNGRGFGLFPMDGEAMAGGKKHARVSRVQVNPKLGHQGRVVTVRRNHLSKKNLVALETGWERIGMMSSSGRHDGVLRTTEVQVLRAHNIEALGIEQRYRKAGSSRVVNEVDRQGYTIGETSVTKGTDIAMFKISDPNREAEITIAPVIVDADTGHRQVDTAHPTTIRFPYRNTWSIPSTSSSLD